MTAKFCSTVDEIKMTKTDVSHRGPGSRSLCKDTFCSCLRPALHTSAVCLYPIVILFVTLFFALANDVKTD